MCKDNYTFCLIHIAQKVTEWIEIYSVKISGDELCSLLNAMKKIKKVEFNSCTILSDSECNFNEMNDCQIDFLSFKYWGLKENSNWETNIERCHNILSGIEKWYNLISCLSSLILKYTFSEDSRQRFELEINRKYTKLKKINLIM